LSLGAAFWRPLLVLRAPHAIGAGRHSIPAAGWSGSVPSQTGPPVGEAGSNQTGRQIVKRSKWLRSASTGTKSDDLKKEVRRQTDQRMKQQKYRENNAGRLEADPRLTPRAP